MADSTLVDILKQGTKVWNEWWITHSLAKLNLSGANLSGTNLSGANLNEADLVGADLRGANLSRANLVGADLRGANLINANLINANLSGANLNEASLSGANLSRGDLTEACLSNAHLRGADLHGANLSGTNLTGSQLNSVDLSNATCFQTVFSDIDLSTVKGLETIRHDGPSSIGVDTLYRSQGKIPEVFLRDCGVPENLITFLPSIVGQAIQYYSCFISYSNQDEAFTQRLHSRLRDAKLRVWYAPEDIKGGEKLHEQIYEAIRYHDKLLLVLSEHSIDSEWVMTEIRRARKLEQQEKKRKLFPVLLTNYETLRDWECFDADTGKDLAIEVREYFIPDFSQWKEHDAFEGAVERLLRDLKASEIDNKLT